MNASTTRYAPRQIQQPATVLKVEICAKSGLLATDKCEEKGKRTSYHEFATKEQMPTEPCSVHGDARSRIVRDLPDAGVPRASLAVDTAQVKPVALKGPTLLADDDPYNAVKSTVRPPKPADPANNEVKPIVPVAEAAHPRPRRSLCRRRTTAEETQVLRAQPVQPTDRAVTAQPAERPLVAEPAQPAQPVDRTQRGYPVERPQVVQPTPDGRVQRVQPTPPMPGGRLQPVQPAPGSRVQPAQPRNRAARPACAAGHTS